MPRSILDAPTPSARASSFASPTMRAALTVMLALTGGCATSSINHYRAVAGAEEHCCDGLRDPTAQKACRADIPRPQGNELSPLNQETFTCVERHFRCDPATGHATRESTQQQFDCLNDLESTQQARGAATLTATAALAR